MCDQPASLPTNRIDYSPYIQRDGDYICYATSTRLLQRTAYEYWIEGGWKQGNHVECWAHKLHISNPFIFLKIDVKNLYFYARAKRHFIHSKTCWRLEAKWRKQSSHVECWTRNLHISNPFVFINIDVKRLYFYVRPKCAPFVAIHVKELDATT